MALYIGNSEFTSNSLKFGTNTLTGIYRGNTKIWPMISGVQVPALGTAWEGGFYIGNIIDQGIEYALVMSPEMFGEQNGFWFTGAGTLVGTPSLTDGFGNTQKLVSAANFNVFTWARSLVINEKNDWYIPARAEWDVIGANKGSLPSGEYFEFNYYWTSNEFSANNAWEYVISTGNHENYWKDSGSANRVIRRVPLLNNSETFRLTFEDGSLRTLEDGSGNLIQET